MKVKIVKAKDTWYLHRVGETFEVEPIDPYNQYKVSSGDFKGYKIDANHCEIITPVKIPFSFEAWDKDRNQPVWTRDGEEVKELTFFSTGGQYKLAGTVLGNFETWTTGGLYSEDNKFSDDYDLFLEHHEREYFVNVFRSGSELSLGMVFIDEEKAIKGIESAKDFVKTINFKA